MGNSNIIEFEKRKMMIKLKENGFQAYQDQKGNFRLWMRGKKSDSAASGPGRILIFQRSAKR